MGPLSSYKSERTDREPPCVKGLAISEWPAPIGEHLSYSSVFKVFKRLTASRWDTTIKSPFLPNKCIISPQSA